MKRLYLATVEHEEVPGTHVHLFHQVKEPSDRAIFARSRDHSKPRELTVTGLFDLTHTISIEPESLAAIESWVKAHQKVSR